MKLWSKLALALAAGPCAGVRLGAGHDPGRRGGLDHRRATTDDRPIYFGFSSGVGGPMGINLSSGSGTCSQQVIDAVCSGALFGQPACTSGGGGPFTCGTLTCVPQQH